MRATMTKAKPRFKAGAALPRLLCRVFILVVVCAVPAARAAPLLPAAVFPFTLDDTGFDGAIAGPEPADEARLQMLDAQLRAALTASGRYRLLDMSDVAFQLAGGSLHGCVSCVTELARAVGAQVAIIGWVQELTKTRSEISLVVRDAASGKMLHSGSVDLRDNTEASWHAGLAWLLAHRIPLAAP